MKHVHESGGRWVSGGKDRRTVSGPEGSSTKAYSLGDWNHLVATGPMDVFCSLRPGFSRSV